RFRAAWLGERKRRGLGVNVAIRNLDERSDAGSGGLGVEAQVFVADAASDAVWAAADAMPSERTARFKLVRDGQIAGEIVLRSGRGRSRPVSRRSRVCVIGRGASVKNAASATASQ